MAFIIKNQKVNKLVYIWEFLNVEDMFDYKFVCLMVDEFMEIDLFIVQKDDFIELVVEFMDWCKICYMFVEDFKGKFVGFIIFWLLLCYYMY